MIGQWAFYARLSKGPMMGEAKKDEERLRFLHTSLLLFLFRGRGRWRYGPRPRIGKGKIVYRTWDDRSSVCRVTEWYGMETMPEDRAWLLLLLLLLFFFHSSIWNSVRQPLELIVTLCKHRFVGPADQLSHMLGGFLRRLTRNKPVSQVLDCLLCFKAG